MKRRVTITADCVCDLPPSILEEYDIPVIYFYVVTDSGCFKDKAEITARNIVEYFERGATRIVTLAPGVEEYRDFFAEELKLKDEIVHICISSKLSASYANACEAACQFEGRVRVFDSETLSTGMGHLVLYAVNAAKEGLDGAQVMEALQVAKSKVTTTFITQDTRKLCLAGKVSKTLDFFCRGLKAHPILKMKHGEMKLIGIQIGNFQRCVGNYVRRELKGNVKIDNRRLFITHCGCSVRTVNLAKRVALDHCKFELVDVTETSATISGNCGANTIGVVYMNI